MKDNFVHLHLHSTYSFTDGYGLPEQYISRAVELGQPGIGVTDHGNVSAHYKWYKQSIKAGLKPILGCEMYIVEDNKDIREREYNHITVLVKNNIGYRNLMKLVTKAWCEQFYYKPRITFQDLFDNQEGLIVLSGCLSSPIMEHLKENRMDEARNMIKLFNERIDNFYIEIQPITFEAGIHAYEKLIDLYHELKHYGIKWVATNDCHYVLEEHNKVQEVLLCVQTRDKMSNPEHWKFDQDDFFLKSRQQMIDSLHKAFPYYDISEFEKACDNSVIIADGVDFEFPKATPIVFPMKEEDKFIFIKSECEKGLERILRKDDKSYRERVDYELDLIKSKGFIDYFLVIHDLVNWAKNKGILVGPARGSAAGSLACYLLRITEVDPMPYDLLFERFIDINREDLPDIDVDFEDSRRYEVKEYIIGKYGADKVGNLPTFAEFKGKSALHDVGSIFEVPFKMVDEIKSLVIERSGGDSRASFTLIDTFTNEEFPRPAEILKQYPSMKYAIELEGQYRQMGQHAAGVVISNEPLTNFCAIYKVKGEQVISLAYEDASSIGLLKIDLLGLSTLSVVSKAIRMIEAKTKKKIDIYNLPLNDPKVYQGFISQKMFGVFQFDGQAVNQVSRQINPRDFNALSAISALARPGPLNGGVTTAYIARRANKEKITYAHPVMKPYTEETYGLVVYQEQVMKTMREVGKMSWKDTAEIRKLISRSQGVEKFNTFKEKFAIGAKENGMNDKQIDDIWNAICTFGSWAFNKCCTMNTEIVNTSPNQFSKKVLTVKELYENNGYATPRWREQPKAYKKMNTLSIDSDGMIRPGRVKDVFYKGKREVVEIKTNNGKSIKITPNHRMLSSNGFKEIQKFKIGDEIATNGGYWNREYKSTNKNGQSWRKGRMVAGPKDKLDGRRIEINTFRKEKEGESCEHCEYFNSRMEVHHVTRTPPNSILEWLCPSCHKIAEYKKGRIKVWQKGFKIEWEKIVSLKFLEPEDVYDIEMEDSSRPTFIANGFISHNSHSVSYTIISYWTMWLKVHHPMEFYSSILSIADPSKKKSIIKEYKREGFKIFPVDINRSKESFAIDGDAIRIGVCDIGGIGPVYGSKILTHQPYVSYGDYIAKNKKSPVPSSATQKLVDLGAFDNLAEKSYEINLFGERIDEYKKNELTLTDRVLICPWDVEFGVEKKWIPFLKEFPTVFPKLPSPISSFTPNEEENPEETKYVPEDAQNNEDVTIMGIVYDKNLKDYREEAGKGKAVKDLAGKIRDGKCKYANFVLEDESDFITVRLSNYAFVEPTCQQIKSVVEDDFGKEKQAILNYGQLIFQEMKPDDVIVVRGKLGNGIRMFFANKILSLRHFKEYYEQNGKPQPILRTRQRKFR